MPILQAAKKTIRKDEKRRAVNDRRRRTYRETVKDFDKLAEAGKIKEATEMLPKVFKSLDKAAKTGVLKKNTASRKKSNAAKKIAVAK